MMELSWSRALIVELGGSLKIPLEMLGEYDKTHPGFVYDEPFHELYEAC
jgi:hypothetical protein